MLPIMIPTKLQAAICLKICNKIIHTAQWKLTSSSSEDIWEHFFGTLHIYGVICKTILLSGSDPDNKSIALSNRLHKYNISYIYSISYIYIIIIYIILVIYNICYI